MRFKVSFSLRNCQGPYFAFIEARKSKRETQTQYNLNEKASVSKVVLEGLPKGSMLRDRDSWFPTVRKMVWVLEQLRDFVQVRISCRLVEESLPIALT